MTAYFVWIPMIIGNNFTRSTIRQWIFLEIGQQIRVQSLATFPFLKRKR